MRHTNQAEILELSKRSTYVVVLLRVCSKLAAGEYVHMYESLLEEIVVGQIVG